VLREGFFGEQSDRMMLLTYETLTGDPKRALDAVYEFIGEKPFAHDFDNVQYDAAEFDARLGTPGLHTVGKVVRAQERDTIHPPDLFRRVEQGSFWRDPALNKRGVRIV
jgi:sulfotransferase